MKLLAQIDIDVPRPVLTYSDNLSSIREISNETSRSIKLRHVDISYKWLLELSKKKVLSVLYCPTSSMVADIFTKAVPFSTHKLLKDMLGMN